MSDPLSDTDLCHVLSCERRRLALEFLWDAREPVALPALAEVVAAVEAGEQVAPRPLRESVYTSRRQTHLPTLARHGLVTFDSSEGHAQATRAARRAVRRLRDQGPLGVTWSETYRAVGTLGLCGVVAALAGVTGPVAVDPLLPAVGGLAAYATVSAYHLWTLRPRLPRAATDGNVEWAPSDA